MNLKTKEQAFIQGFSSDDEYVNDTLQNYRLNDDNEARQIDFHDYQKKSVLNKISPPGQIKQKNYSLQPDLQTGWNPRIYLPKPIPLTFCNSQLDFDIQMIIKTLKADQPLELCYLGPRYESTYSAWYDKPFPFPYNHLNSTKRLKFTDRQFCGQYWNSQTKDHLLFDSFYESANLDSAFKVGQTQYDLFMRVDSNTRGHFQWYNFKVRNMIKDVKYKFNICNFQKGKSLYARGMKPYIYSRERFLKTKVGWTQIGENVQYQKKTPKTFKITQTEMEFKPLRLSFEYTNFYDQDQVQIAYCIPYEYTKLLNFTQEMQRKCAEKNILKVSKLCHSLGGFSIPIITVTNKIDQIVDENIQFKDKKIVFISGRVHPGQSNSSYMMQGFINFICSDCEQSQTIRNSVIFKIVPMINPDGVVIGNYRTSLSGRDLNREFINPDKNIFPEIVSLKEMIWKYKRVYQNNFLMFLDFHGHSVKKNVFTYGPQFPITNNNYYESRIFPKLISMKTPMFRFFSCSFKVSQCKQSTARAVLFKNFGINLVYTVQASNGCFYNIDKLEDIMFDEQKIRQVGQSIGKAINDYIKLQSRIMQHKLKKKEERLKIKRIKQKERIKQVSRNKLQVKGYQTSYSPFKKQPTEKILIQSQNSRSKQTFKDNILPYLKNQQFGDLLKQICDLQTQEKDQKQLSEKNKAKSDDQISEGGSDTSGSSQDLDAEQRSNLYSSIKKGNQKLSRKFVKPKASNIPQTFNKTSKNIKILNNQKFLTEVDGDYDDQQQQIKKINMNASFKINEFKHKRNIYLKRKINNINFTPSPKKEDNRAYTAKIVNFHFALQPTVPFQSTAPYNNIISDEGVSPQIRKSILASDYLTTQSPQIKRNSRLNDYSQNFKKTFLSVQKQMSQKSIANKRKSEKKNVVHSFYQICVPKKLQNLRGKRIQTQTESTNPQLD